MASLTSVNLQARVSVSPRDWQFDEADNPYDLNWLTTRVGVARQGEPGQAVLTRVVAWELIAFAETVGLMAEGRLSAWRSGLLDSGLHVQVDRAAERGDLFDVAVLVSHKTGPLPADFAPEWQDDWLFDRSCQVWGVRLMTTPAALGLFAAELQAELRGFEPRHWRRPDDVLVAPPTAGLRLELAARLRELTGRGGH